MRADLSPLSAVLAQHALGLVVLFGSRARGTDLPRSDVDLGVLRTDRRPLDYRSLGELKLMLSRHIGFEADVVDLATPDAVFRYQVVLDGRPLFEAEPGQWSDFVGRALVDWDDIAPFVRACVQGVGRAAEEASAR